MTTHHGQPFARSARLPVLLAAAVWLASGCSGSNESSEDDTPGSIDAGDGTGVPVVNEDAVVAGSITDGPGTIEGGTDEEALPSADAVDAEVDAGADADAGEENIDIGTDADADTGEQNTDFGTDADVDVDTDTDVVDTDTDGSAGNDVDEPGTVEDGADASVDDESDAGSESARSTLPVTFEITVPQYVSGELSVELSWGEIDVTAAWIGDQFWSVSVELPTETEQPLTIGFFDRDGAVELGRFEGEYRVGSNVAEPVRIPADAFDVARFDDDGDGTSNLDESIAGSDPLVDERTLPELRDGYAIATSSGRFSRLSVSESFEALVTDERPYSDTFDSAPYLSGPLAGAVDIDAEGNGTLDINTEEEPRRFLDVLSGIRTRSNDSVTWTGNRLSSDSEYVHAESFVNTVSVVDERLRSFVQESTGSNNGTFRFAWEIDADLTGELIEGTSACRPVAGTVTTSHETRDPALSVVVTTARKTIDEPYWNVVVEEEAGRREYRVRELAILGRPDAPDSAFFLCDFVDF